MIDPVRDRLEAYCHPVNSEEKVEIQIIKNETKESDIELLSNIQSTENQ